MTTQIIVGTARYRVRLSRRRRTCQLNLVRLRQVEGGGKQLKAADLRGKTVRQMSDSELHRLVHNGRGNMPPYSDQLSSERMDQVVKYVRTLGEILKK